MGASRKKQRKAERQAQRELGEQLVADGTLPEGTILSVGKETDKLSAALLELAKPLVELTENEDIAVSLSAAAWNAALFAQPQRDEMVETVLSAMSVTDAEAVSLLRRTMNAMVERKLALYPDDRRLIARHAFTAVGGKRILNVASIALDRAPRAER